MRVRLYWIQLKSPKNEETRQGAFAGGGVDAPHSEGGQTGIQTISRQIHLFGGVGLSVDPTNASKGGRARGLE